MKLVVPGEPTRSYLLLRVHHFEPEEMNPPQPAVPVSEEADFYMPQDFGLCEGKAGAIFRWVQNGCPM